MDMALTFNQGIQFSSNEIIRLTLQLIFSFQT